MQVLQLDRQGQPQDWLTPREAVMYYATDSVCWTMGEVCSTLRGGVNAVTGLQSRIDVHPIIAVNGVARANLFDAVPSLTNAKLFARDKWTCSYCAKVHSGGVGLTRDHIIPRGQGGEDSWINCTSACRKCNHFKNCRTPEQARMPLLMTPYVPSVFEGFILSGRKIHGDALDFLSTRVPKNSRWYAGH